MKGLFCVAVCLLSLGASAQYYYRDIVGLKESTDLIAKYRTAGVQTVTMKSYTVNNTPVENLSVEQVFSPQQSSLLTITRSGYLPTSYLRTSFDADGRVVRTTDSTESYVNTTVYSYNNAGNVASISTRFSDTLSSLRTDEHIWQYHAQNRVSKMLRIKNGRDTAVVSFKFDDAGNVVEEQETRRIVKEEPFYYYYDAKNRLTDIVRYNKKAARLLPEQMFDYAVSNNLIQRTTVAPNSDDYLVWRYRFNDKGLKTREEIFNKQKELTGKVEYSYTFSNQ